MLLLVQVWGVMPCIDDLDCDIIRVGDWDVFLARTFWLHAPGPPLLLLSLLLLLSVLLLTPRIHRQRRSV